MLTFLSDSLSFLSSSIHLNCFKIPGFLFDLVFLFEVLLCLLVTCLSSEAQEGRCKLLPPVHSPWSQCYWYFLDCATHTKAKGWGEGRRSGKGRGRERHAGRDRAIGGDGDHWTGFKKNFFPHKLILKSWFLTRNDHKVNSRFPRRSLQFENGASDPESHDPMGLRGQSRFSKILGPKESF